jgi:hypothetical protein
MKNIIMLAGSLKEKLIGSFISMPFMARDQIEEIQIKRIGRKKNNNLGA